MNALTCSHCGSSKTFCCSAAEQEAWDAMARESAKTYVDEFPGEAPDEAWCTTAYEIDGCPGAYTDYWNAFARAVRAAR